MIPVSSAWRSAQNEMLLPEMFVEITYEITEPGLQEEAVATGSNPEDFSNIAQVVSRVDKNSEKYAMLDYGCWGLDGSYEYFDGTPTDPGYVDAAYSEADGSMRNIPTITIDFAKRHDNAIPGMIITWDKAFGTWAEDFRIKVYDANGVVAQTTVKGNKSTKSTIVLDIVNYSKITVEVLKWSHPYQRPRCIDIVLGIRAVYTKNDLIGYEHKQSVDLLSAKLPESEISFRLRNDDNRWNPDTPLGAERYLLEQQEVKVRYGMDVGGSVEWINGGTFWISEWTTPTNGLEADFTARDAIEFMVNDYTGTRTGTLYDIAVAALTEANLTVLESGSVRYLVDESLKDITTDFSTDNKDYSIAEVLQMIANAGNCVFYQDRDGVVRIEPHNKRYCGYRIEPRISYAHPEYEMNKPLKFVTVNYGTQKQSESVEVSSRGENQTVKNPLLITKEDALRVGVATADLLKNRKVISGEFRADMLMDALDNVIVVSKYASNVISVTDVEYSTSGGTFRGKYTGRVISIDLEAAKLYSNEFKAGEVW